MASHFRFSKPILSSARQHGFTYLWVLIVVALMGFLLAGAVENSQLQVQREKEQELLSIGRQFKEALRSYHENSVVREGLSGYPMELTDLLDDARSSVRKRHLRKIFTDPMTGTMNWGVVRAGNRIVGVHSLSKKTPLKREGFASDEGAFKGASAYSDWVFSASIMPKADLTGH